MSWVIVHKETGKAVAETWSEELAKKSCNENYKTVPILEYLQSLNQNKGAD